MENEKCVMVIDENLPLGLVANTAAILGITLGRERGEVVGGDVYDGDGNRHLGIIEFPVPILRAAPEAIRSLRERLYTPEFASVTAVDFSDLAQGCKTYDEYREKLSAAPESALRYYVLALIGAKKLVNKLTGSLALLR